MPPERQTVFEMNGSRLPSRTKTRGVCGQFSQYLSRSYSEDIFEPIFGGDLNPDDVSLYVSNRSTGKVGAAQDDADHGHQVIEQNASLKEFFERSFHTAFEKPDQQNPIILLVGKEGIGKSTFLRYYFDFYRNKDGVSGSLTGKDHIFHVDVPRKGFEEDIKMQFFSQLASQIHYRYPDLSSENHYAMWNRKKRWDNQLHKDAAPSGKVNDRYRAQQVERLCDDNEVFAIEALWYLADQAGGEKKRVSLVVDNLDQQDDEVISKIFSLIASWFGKREVSAAFHRRITNDFTSLNEIMLWRVVFAFRPETLEAIWRNLESFESGNEIWLGEIEKKSLIESRNLFFDQKISESGTQVSIDLPVSAAKPGTGEFCLTVPNLLIRSRFSELLSAVPDDQKSEYSALIRMFSNSSNRRFFRIRKRVFLNPGIEEHFFGNTEYFENQIRSALGLSFQSRKLSNYKLVSAWLAGSDDLARFEDKECDLVNVFCLTSLSPSPFTLLIGPFLLHVIREVSDEYNWVIERFKDVGFRGSEVDSCLDRFYQKKLVGTDLQTMKLSNRILVEKCVVNAYWQFIQHPAYIDAVAMHTPIDATTLKSCLTANHLIRPTRFYVLADMFDRAHTSVCFVRQLAKDEDHFRTWRDTDNRQRVDGGAFAGVIEELNLPSPSVLAARALIGRFAKITPPLGSESARNINEILAPIENVAKRDSHYIMGHS